MNSNFSQEQIEAYASAFEEGDAIWCDGEWREVSKLSKFSSSLTCEAPNRYVIRCFDGKAAISGFKEEENPYRVTTLEDYKLQGGEKLVYLDDDDFGRRGSVFKAKMPQDEYLKEPYWGIIPRYEQVKHLVDPTKKKPKFKVGDVVTVKTYKAPATVREVHKTTGTYIYSVEYNGDKSMKFWESDLELYRQEEEEDRPASSHYHDNNNGNDVWQFADDNLSDERVKGFHQINAIKYVARYEKKHETAEKRIEDLKKAKVSIDKLIELEELE